MPKRAFIGGEDGKARRVTKMYVGVDDTAKKVQRGYIGVGGVARPFFFGGELTYYGEISPINQKRYDLAATAIGDHALIGGGRYHDDGTTVTSYTDVYNKDFTKGTAIYGYGRHCLSATHNDKYAMFGGGYSGTSTGYPSDTVWAFNEELQRVGATSFPIDVGLGAATYFNGYAIFSPVDGDSGSSSAADVSDWFCAYNNNLVRTRVNTYVMEASQLGTLGDWLFVGEGANVNYGSDNVYRYDYETDVYDKDFVRKTTMNITSDKRGNYVFATVGRSNAQRKMLLVAGGNGDPEGEIWEDPVASDVVDVIYPTLSRGTPIRLRDARTGFHGVDVEDFAVFLGGCYYEDDPEGEVRYYTRWRHSVEVFDDLLLRYHPDDMLYARTDHAVTVFNDSILVAGGQGTTSTTYFSYTPINSVEVYKVL